jgi:UDPglucose 6-dehydrogenase
MQLTIAGYGSIGRYIESVFGRKHDISVYDPPCGFKDERLLRETDFVFVCVPTPPRDDGSCDTSSVEQVVSMARPRVAVICESTLPVGTTDRLIATYRKPLVFVPEYAGDTPDHPLRDPRRRDFFIYGGHEPAASAVRDLFQSVYPKDANHSVVEPRVAELVKYMENSFLALKVTFCNEFFDLCEAFGASYDQVRDLWAQDSRVGGSHIQVKAERGFAGKCLPKDVAAICSVARDAGVPLELMETVQRVNARVRLAALECEATDSQATRR